MDSEEVSGGGWEFPKKVVRRPTGLTEPRELRVVLDLQTMDFDGYFQPRFLRTNITNAVEEVMKDKFRYPEIKAYLMAEPTEEYQRNLVYLGKFCEIIICYSRKPRCRECKRLVAQERKRKLS
ncbi:unnamed protein product [Arabis nemorensis]|uniref:Uncharacterized protein n=1 Tax=Arabis nemorensis TaxID=586526 RepID=A0A565BE51_9BRAS|nr:unnamed protein product [Arabis nemorensis]